MQPPFATPAAGQPKSPRRRRPLAPFAASFAGTARPESPSADSSRRVGAEGLTAPPPLAENLPEKVPAGVAESGAAEAAHGLSRAGSFPQPEGSPGAGGLGDCGGSGSDDDMATWT